MAVAPERAARCVGLALDARHASGLKPFPRVSLVMPTLSEAENLPHVIPRLPAGLHELIVVDGFSTDDTVKVVQELYPQVRIVFQTRPGKGNALACGIAAASGDIIATLDSDGSTDPQELRRFIEAIEAGADFAKGSRFLSGGGSDDITRFRKVGNWLLTRLVNLLFGTRYTDLCYGFNALRAEAAAVLAPDTDGFEIETLLCVRAAKAGLNVQEVPSWESCRVHGTSNLKVIPDGWRVLRTILREWATPMPPPSPRPSLAEDLLERAAGRGPAS